MFKLFNKKDIAKPDKPCKIDIILKNVNPNTINKLPTNGNNDLIITDNKVEHKKYGVIGMIPKNKIDRLNKLNEFTYYWNTYNIFADNEDASVADIIGKGFNLKIY